MNCISKKQIYMLLIIAVVIVLDQVSKTYIFANIGLHKSHYATSFLNIVHALNKGISFGMFNSKPLHPHFFTALNICIVFMLFFWAMRGKEHNIEIYIALIIGGAIGNIIDRFYHGAVIDFIDFHIYGHHYPAFNVADSAICIGAFLIIVTPFFTKKH